MSEQLGLFEPPELPPAVLADGTHVRVLFTCPHCRHTWHGASLVIGAWWYSAPEQVAKQPHCPRCAGLPPMLFTTDPPIPRNPVRQETVTHAPTDRRLL